MRKPAGRSKEKGFYIRLSDAESATISALAKADGYTITAYVRLCLGIPHECARADVLACVRTEQRVTVSDVAKRVKSSKKAVLDHLKTLEESGHVRRSGKLGHYLVFSPVESSAPCTEVFENSSSSPREMDSSQPSEATRS